MFKGYPLIFMLNNSKIFLYLKLMYYLCHMNNKI